MKDIIIKVISLLNKVILLQNS